MQVYRAKATFEHLGVRVLFITFGHAYWAEAWRAETGVGFPILLDQARTVYRAYGLERSLRRTYSPRTLLFYAKKFLRGEGWRPARGDPRQLGGDFVVGADGRIVLAHPSRDPIDRPSVNTLLEAIRARGAEEAPCQLPPTA